MREGRGREGQILKEGEGKEEGEGGGITQIWRQRHCCFIVISAVVDSICRFIYWVQTETGLCIFCAFFEEIYLTDFCTFISRIFTFF